MNQPLPGEAQGSRAHHPFAEQFIRRAGTGARQAGTPVGRAAGPHVPDPAPSAARAPSGG